MDSIRIIRTWDFKKIHFYYNLTCCKCGKSVKRTLNDEVRSDASKEYIDKQLSILKGIADKKIEANDFVCAKCEKASLKYPVKEMTFEECFGKETAEDLEKLRQMQNECNELKSKLYDKICTNRIVRHNGKEYLINSIFTPDYNRVKDIHYYLCVVSKNLYSTIDKHENVKNIIDFTFTDDTLEKRRKTINEL